MRESSADPESAGVAGGERYVDAGEQYLGGRAGSCMLCSELLHVRAHAEIDLPEAGPDALAEWAWSAFMEAVDAVGIVTRSRNRIWVPVTDRVNPDTAYERLIAWLATPPPERHER